MAKKSSVIKEISEQLNNLNIDIFEVDEEELKEIHLSLYDLTDERHDSYTVHFLPDIVFMVLFSVLANCKEWEEINDFAEIHKEWFAKYLKLPGGIPSISTFQRAMAVVEPSELEVILVNIILTTLKEYEDILQLGKEKDIVSLDGKTCNGSKRQNSKNGKVKSINAMSAFSNRYEVALTTAFIGEKTNEIPTGEKIIEKLNLKDIIVTADALNTQKKTVKAIIKSKGDYVLALKNNHEDFYEDVKFYFEDEYNLDKCDYIKEEEKSHSSLIQYQYFTTNNIEWLINKEDWEGLRSIACVVKENYNLITGEYTMESRYYISSLNNDIKNIAKSIREHWGIENKLHWQLDYTFKEDKNTTFVGNSQKNLNIIRKFCLSLLKLVKENYQNKSLAKIQFRLGINFENEIPKFINYLNTDKIKEELASRTNSSIL